MLSVRTYTAETRPLKPTAERRVEEKAKPAFRANATNGARHRVGVNSVPRQPGSAREKPVQTSLSDDATALPISASINDSPGELIETPPNTRNRLSVLNGQAKHQLEERLSRPLQSNHDQLSRYTQSFSETFKALAANQVEFQALMQHSFSQGGASEQAIEQFRIRVLAGDFSWLPNIHLLDNAQMHGANGAYSAQSNTVYLAIDALDSPIAYATFVEEVGHSIDALLNQRDTQGDEGAVFALLLGGAAVSSPEVRAQSGENDSGVISINGFLTPVEFSWLSKELERAGRRVQRVTRSVINAFQNVGKSVSGLVDDVATIATVIAKRPFEVSAEIINGTKKMVNLVLHGNINDAYLAIRNALLNSGKLSASLVGEVALMSLSAAITAIDRMRGAINERSLTQNEITYMRTIFGDSIDYGSVNIITGGLKDQLGMDAHVVGNAVFLPNQDGDGQAVFSSTGTLTTAGLDLLAHELTHVWQFQHYGTGYIVESVVRQLYDGDNDTYNWWHDVQSGVPFSQMNPEKQAEIASLIGRAIAFDRAAGGDGTLTEAALQAVLDGTDIVLSTPQFTLFEQAHALLQSPENTALTSQSKRNSRADQLAVIQRLISRRH